MQNAALEAKVLEVKAAIETEVNAISDLTPEQATAVIDIAVAYTKTHGFQLPNISGIANHVRSTK
jgi:glycerate kinase